MRSALCFQLIFSLFFLCGALQAMDVINFENYNSFGWRPFQTPSQNVSVSFQAMAGSDIFLAFQYGDNQYLDINIGGWGNSNTGISQIENNIQSNFATSSLVPNPIITPWTWLNYEASINNNLLTITCMGTTITQHDISYLAGKLFTGYSFKGWSWAPWYVLSHSAKSAPSANSSPTPENATTLSTSDFNTYGWKPIATPSNNLTMSFDAIAQNDIHIALQYPGDQYIFICIGGWGNAQGVIRQNTMPESTMIDISAPGLIIPRPGSSVRYTISIATTNQFAGSTLTVTADGTPIYTLSAPFLTQNYTNYSFRSWPPTTVTLSNVDVVTTAAVQQSSDLPRRIAGNYQVFGFKDISTPGSSVTVSFDAKAKSDIHLALQYDPDSLIEICIGGWGNTQSVVRNYRWNALFNEEFIPSANQVIPDISNFVQFSVQVINGNLTVSANGTPIIKRFISFVSGLQFNKYSFKGLGGLEWDMKNDSTKNNTTQSPITYTSSSVPTGTYWLQKNYDPNLFLSADGMSWVAEKAPFSITKNPTNLSFSSINYPQNSGSLELFNQTFVYIPATQTEAVAIASITVDDFNSYSWKDISQQSGFTLSFDAKATIDLHIGFKDAQNNTLLIVLGGWNNTQSALVFLKNNAPILTRYIRAESQVTPSTKVIPDVNSFVKYTVTISNGCVYITANNIPLINFSHTWIKEKQFNNYSFKKWSGAPSWTLQSPSISTPNQIPSPAPLLVVAQDEQEIFADDYTLFGWQALPAPSPTLNFNFSAKASSDLIIGFQYANNSYIEIVIGGWNNTKSCVRNIASGQIINEIMITSTPKPIADTTNFLNYTVSLQNKTLTVTANQSQIISITQDFLTQKTFSHYAFKVFSESPAWILKRTGSITKTLSSSELTEKKAQAAQAMQTLANTVDPINTTIANAKIAFTTLAAQIKYTGALPW
jgi:hypothetical protein